MNSFYYDIKIQGNLVNQEFQQQVLKDASVSES